MPGVEPKPGLVLDSVGPPCGPPAPRLSLKEPSVGSAESRPRAGPEHTPCQRRDPHTRRPARTSSQRRSLSLRTRLPETHPHSPLQPQPHEQAQPVPQDMSSRTRPTTTSRTSPACPPRHVLTDTPLTAPPEPHEQAQPVPQDMSSRTRPSRPHRPTRTSRTSPACPPRHVLTDTPPRPSDRRRRGSARATVSRPRGGAGPALSAADSSVLQREPWRRGTEGGSG